MEEKEKITVQSENLDNVETEKEIVPKKKSLWKQLVMGVVYALLIGVIVIDLSMAVTLLLLYITLSSVITGLCIICAPGILLPLLLTIIFKAVTEIFIDRKYKNATAEKKAEKKRSARKICRIVFGCSFLIIMTTSLCILTYSSTPILHHPWSEKKCLFCNEYHSTGRCPGIKYIEYDPNYECPYCGKIGDRHTCDQAICKKCGIETRHCFCNDMGAKWQMVDNSNESCIEKW